METQRKLISLPLSASGIGVEVELNFRDTERPEFHVHKEYYGIGGGKFRIKNVTMKLGERELRQLHAQLSKSLEDIATWKDRRDDGQAKG